MVRAVSGLTASRESNGVREVELTARQGTVVGELNSSWDRLGHVLATGATGAEAARNAAAAAALVEVRTS